MTLNKIAGCVCSVDEEKNLFHMAIPMEEEFLPSRTSGKTLIVSSTHGVLRTAAKVNKKNIRITFTAFIPTFSNSSCFHPCPVPRDVPAKPYSDKAKKFLEEKKVTVDPSDEEAVERLIGLLFEYRAASKKTRRQLRRLGYHILVPDVSI